MEGDFVPFIRLRGGLGSRVTARGACQSGVQAGATSLGLSNVTYPRGPPIKGPGWASNEMTHASGLSRLLSNSLELVICIYHIHHILFLSLFLAWRENGGVWDVSKTGSLCCASSVPQVGSMGCRGQQGRWTSEVGCFRACAPINLGDPMDSPPRKPFPADVFPVMPPAWLGVTQSFGAPTTSLAMHICHFPDFIIRVFPEIQPNVVLLISKRILFQPSAVKWGTQL